jgi:hypothetical protein
VVAAALPRERAVRVDDDVLGASPYLSERVRTDYDIAWTIFLALVLASRSTRSDD